MKTKTQTRSDSRLMVRRLLLLQASYRWPMKITEVMAFQTSRGESGYYVCPRCRCTLERQFTAYCDRCGQRLDWQDCEKAKVIYPGQS